PGSRWWASPRSSTARKKAGAAASSATAASWCALSSEDQTSWEVDVASWRFPLCLLLLGACAAPRVDFHEIARVYAPDDYARVQKRWTRTSTLYRELSTVSVLWATLQTWDWRQAYVARYAFQY